MQKNSAVPNSMDQTERMDASPIPRMDQTQPMDASPIPQMDQTQPMDASPIPHPMEENQQPDASPIPIQLQRVDPASSPIQLPVQNRPSDVDNHDEERLTPPEDDETLRSGAKIANWATALTGTSIMAFAIAVFGSKNTIPSHKRILFACSLISLCISFAFGVLMLILQALCHSSPDMTKLIKMLKLGAIVGAALGVLSGVAFGIQMMI